MSAMIYSKILRQRRLCQSKTSASEVSRKRTHSWRSRSNRWRYRTPRKAKKSKVRPSLSTLWRSRCSRLRAFVIWIPSCNWKLSRLRNKLMRPSISCQNCRRSSLRSERRTSDRLKWCALSYKRCRQDLRSCRMMLTRPMLDMWLLRIWIERMLSKVQARTWVTLRVKSKLNSCSRKLKIRSTCSIVSTWHRRLW